VRPSGRGGVKLTIASPKSAVHGSRLSYTVSLNLKGNGVLPNLVLRNQLPPQFTYRLAIPAPSSISSGALIWDLGTVQGPAVVRVRVDVDVASGAVSGQVVTNSATAGDTEGYSASATSKVTIR